MDSHLTGWDWFLLKPWKVQRIGDNIPCRQNAKSPSRFVDENRKWFRKSIKIMTQIMLLRTQSTRTSPRLIVWDIFKEVCTMIKPKYCCQDLELSQEKFANWIFKLRVCHSQPVCSLLELGAPITKAILYNVQIP